MYARPLLQVFIDLRLDGSYMRCCPRGDRGEHE